MMNGEIFTPISHLEGCEPTSKLLTLPSMARANQKSIKAFGIESNYNNRVPFIWVVFEYVNLRMSILTLLSM